MTFEQQQKETQRAFKQMIADYRVMVEELDAILGRQVEVMKRSAELKSGWNTFIDKVSDFSLTNQSEVIKFNRYKLK